MSNPVQIIAVGAAAPAWRLPATEVAAAWSRKGGRGQAAACPPDEDVLTLAADAALRALTASGLQTDIVDGLWWGTTRPPFAEGLVTVQDVVASEVAPFVAPEPGERILDLCAGVGGKAIHLAEIAAGGAEIVAADVSAARLAKLAENLARLRTPGVRIAPLDTTDLATLGPFDRVLVDAPCSNSGVLMKRVAARFRLTQEAVLALARTELALLNRGAALLRPGGTLVYATCSILPQENSAVVTRFMEEHGAARPRNPCHFADAFRHVREQHDAKLRSHDVEAVVRELERLTIHHAGLDGQSLLAAARREELEHDRRLIRRHHVRAQARRRDAQRTAPGGDVEEPHT